MGSLVGHVIPGFGFLIIGLWHLFNHIKLHKLNPNSYNGPPWFPAPNFKYLELILIMAGSAASVAMELFIGPNRHQPLDPDGTIPSNHLHNFEHSSISMTFFTYAAFAIILHRSRVQIHQSLTQLLAAVAFGQQLLLFHLHSADHMGPEGQYHLMLQLIVFVSLSTSIIGIGLSNSFLVNFVRSLSIFSQGLWLMVMGVMLWTPAFIAKGCFINDEDGHGVVRCSTHEAVHRANALVNVLFSWFFITMAVFAVSLYMVLVKVYDGEEKKVVYFSLGNEENEEEESNDDVESQQGKSTTRGSNVTSFIHVKKKGLSDQMDMER